MEIYKKTLESLYTEKRSRDCGPENKLQFLSSDIFEFITYDGNADEVFAKTMLEVVECILTHKNFEYQEAKYFEYLTMVNMPFLQEKLDWGTSIRGAFFDVGYCLDENKEDFYYLIGRDIKIPKQEVEVFMTQMIEWSKSI